MIDWRIWDISVFIFDNIYWNHILDEIKMFFVLFLLHMYFPRLQYKAVKTPPIKKNSYTLNFICFKFFTHLPSWIVVSLSRRLFFFCIFGWDWEIQYTYGLGWESRFWILIAFTYIKCIERKTFWLYIGKYMSRIRSVYFI